VLNLFIRSLFLLSASIYLAACTHSLPKDAGAAGKIQRAERNPELWPKPQSPFPAAQTAEINLKVEALLAKMSLAQKVGQITQAEISRTTPDDVRKYHLGSVLNGGGGFLNGNKHASLQEWNAALDTYYDASMDTSNGRLAIPITWGSDAVHGHNKIYGATLFPHNIGLGATRNPALIKKIGEITALQVRASGMDWTFSPSLSVVDNDRWGRTYEGFSEDPKLVAELGQQMILGYQGDMSRHGKINAEHVIATAKHFLADGGTQDGIDRGNNYATEQELIAHHAYPYFSAVAAGVQTIMASHSSWQGVRMHGEHYLLTEILKNRLGFDGFVVGDWNSHGLVEGCTNTHCPESINAGVDMLMVPFDWKEFITNTIKDVESGAITMARLDDAVRRILRVKFRAGLFDAKPSQRLYAKKSQLIASNDIQTLARQAVRESLVLLKNNDQTLPIKPNQKILVVGEAANNIAQQSGGWTISWQSTDIQNSDFPNGTSILQGIRQAVNQAGGKVEYSVEGKYKQKPDIAIVVYGESPYAEWQGDVRHLGYQTGSHKDAKLLEKYKNAGIKTVSVFISGRPMWVNRELNASDAFVAAWLPGTEGQGVADVLIADVHHKSRFDFRGKLAFSWPKSLDQSKLNVGDADYAPLFPFGFGLSYANPNANLQNLPTDENVAALKGGDTVDLFVGTAQDPWQVYAASDKQIPMRYLSGIAKNGAMTLTEGDKKTQGDAIHATWDGSALAALQINNPNANRNFTAQLEQISALVFDIRLLQPSSAPVLLQMACRGENCKAEMDITTLVNASPVNDWNELSIDLDCFASKGVNFAEITRAFALVTSGKLELQVANIRIAPGMGDKAGIQCK
jgi:beta-glucosidase